MLVVMIAIRKSLDCIFTRRELQILDDIMPEMSKRAAAEDLHQLDDGSNTSAGGVANGGELTGIVTNTSNEKNLPEVGFFDRIVYFVFDLL